MNETDPPQPGNIFPLNIDRLPSLEQLPKRRGRPPKGTPKRELPDGRRGPIPDIETLRKDFANAQRLRENARQLQERGDVGPRGEGARGPHLEQPAPRQPSDPVRAQAQPHQEARQEIDIPSFTAGMEYFLAQFSDLIARDRPAITRARQDVLRGREGKYPPKLIHLFNVWILWREEAQRAIDAYGPHPILTKPPTPPYGGKAGAMGHREIEWHELSDDIED